MSTSGEVGSENPDSMSLDFLFVSSDTYPPFRVDVSVLFGTQFAARGHRITWLLQSEASCDTDYQTQWNGFPVTVGATDHGESRMRRVRKHYLNLRNDMKLFRIARDHKLDFIQVKDKFLSALAAIVAARRHNCGFVYWLSYPFPEASLYEAKIGTARYRSLYWIRGHVFRVILYRVIARYSDHIFVQSEQMKRDVVAQGVLETKVTAVPMGYSPDQFVNVSTVASQEMSTNSIVYLGTLLKTRRMDFLVRVLARVVEIVPDATLYMVGPEELPGDMEILTDEASRLGVSKNLVLTGRLERDVALSYVAGSQICVSPFYPTPILNSTSPTKLVEYMALEKPVVANDHPEQRLIINESDGGLCVAYEESEFADAVIRLLQDKELARTMGQNGAAYVSKHRTYSTIADKVENRYRQIIQNQR